MKSTRNAVFVLVVICVSTRGVRSMCDQGLPNAPDWTFQEPLWWDTISDDPDIVGLKRCFRRQFPPAEGNLCATRTKTCFFGNQECPGIGPQPTCECFCDGARNNPGTWSCKDVACPDYLAPCTADNVGDFYINDCEEKVVCEKDESPEGISINRYHYVKYREREEFTCMSKERRQRFIDTYKKVTDSGALDDLLNLHGTYSGFVHGTEQYFLPWHRWYIMAVEDVLRKENCAVTMPWWRWTRQSSNWWDGVPPFFASDNWLGTNGDPDDNECVADGPFRQSFPWEPAAEEVGTCLKRDFDRSPMPTFLDISNVFGNHPWPDFRGFSNALEGYVHSSPHCRINGFMCSIKRASKAPEFFLHHAFIDKLWDEWQQPPTHAYDYPRFPDMLYTIGDTSASFDFHLDLKTSGVIYVKEQMSPSGPSDATLLPLQCCIIAIDPLDLKNLGLVLGPPPDDDKVDDDKVDDDKFDDDKFDDDDNVGGGGKLLLFNLDEIEAGLRELRQNNGAPLLSIQQRPLPVQSIEEMKGELFFLQEKARGVSDEVLEEQLKKMRNATIAANSQLQFPTTVFQDDASTMLGFDVLTIIEMLNICPIGSTRNEVEGCSPIPTAIQTEIDWTLGNSTLFLANPVNNADLGSSPTANITQNPSSTPSSEPTADSSEPTADSTTQNPSSTPSSEPTADSKSPSTSSNPTLIPTGGTSIPPSFNPTSVVAPTDVPVAPTIAPAVVNSTNAPVVPTTVPSVVPSFLPTGTGTNSDPPSLDGSFSPTGDGGLISGRVTEDTDGDGAGDVAVGVVTISLLDSSGILVLATTTDSSGAYLFENVPAGSYSISTTTIPGWIDVSDIDGISDGIIGVTLEQGGGSSSNGNDFVVGQNTTNSTRM